MILMNSNKIIVTLSVIAMTQYANAKATNAVVPSSVKGNVIYNNPNSNAATIENLHAQIQELSRNNVQLKNDLSQAQKLNANDKLQISSLQKLSSIKANQVEMLQKENIKLKNQSQSQSQNPINLQLSRLTQDLQLSKSLIAQKDIEIKLEQNKSKQLEQLNNSLRMSQISSPVVSDPHRKLIIALKEFPNLQCNPEISRYVMKAVEQSFNKRQLLFVLPVLQRFVNPAEINQELESVMELRHLTVDLCPSSPSSFNNAGSNNNYGGN